MELVAWGKLVGAATWPEGVVGGRLGTAGGGHKSAPTPAELTAIKAAIAGAQTLEDVAKLEDALKAGQAPDDMDEG